MNIDRVREADLNDEEALQLAMRVIERVMAGQHPGRPAFYALNHARLEIKSAAHDIERRGPGEPEVLPAA